MKKIVIKRFKIFEEFECSFSEFNLLTGLNNSGKTTILQAIYLVCTGLKYLKPNQDEITFNLRDDISSVGIYDKNWIHHKLDLGNEVEITLILENGSSVKFFTQKSNTAVITLSKNFDRSVLKNLVAEFLPPPGNVPSNETLIFGPQLKSEIIAGKGANYWRNIIYWQVQRNGLEAFEPVKALVKKWFPSVDLQTPVLDEKNSPAHILIRYNELQQNDSFDIALSGAGLRTFISLAQLILMSKSTIFLIDEPDSHLHAQQQNVVFELLYDFAYHENKQVIITSHSPELINRTPIEDLKWIDPSKGAPPDIQAFEVLEDLGVELSNYSKFEKMPDYLIYVEGVTDKRIIQSIIQPNMREKGVSFEIIPSKTGRFNTESLSSISNLLKNWKHNVKIIGFRDLDWEYGQKISSSPEVEIGDGYKLVTLPFKEIENLFCSPSFIQHLFNDVSAEDILNLVAQATSNADLVNEWEIHIIENFRKNQPSHLDPSTKEKNARKLISEIKKDRENFWRYLSGKKLLKIIREKLKDEYDKELRVNTAIVNLKEKPDFLMFFINEINN